VGHKIDGTSWATGIKNPQNPETYVKTVMLADTSCVTSGNYERFFTVGGQRYHHIIDKDTLMPATYFSSITILAKDSGLADALSTALFTMSYEDGKAIVDSLEDVEAIWIYKDKTIAYTDGVNPINLES
jgi:thiamine biosynthesis lipoprotein